MTDFLQLFITGLALGGIYSLIAVGFGAIYNATGIIHFAHGEFVMLGAMLMSSFVGMFGVGMSAVLVSLGVGVLGYFLYEIFLRPLEHRSMIEKIVMTISFSLTLRGGALLIWGKSIHLVPHFSGEAPLIFLGMVIPSQSLWIIGLVFLCALSMTFFLKKTFWGRAFSAVSDNMRGAQLTGLPVRKIVGAAFFFSAFLGALAGIFIAPISLANYQMGTGLAVKGFAVLILGGLGSYTGALLSGFFLGTVEVMTASYINSSFKDFTALFFLLIILVMKPSGLFGNRLFSKMKKY